MQYAQIMKTNQAHTQTHTQTRTLPAHSVYIYRQLNAKS